MKSWFWKLTFDHVYRLDSRLSPWFGPCSVELGPCWVCMN